jgi:hypothetical protein
MIDPMPNGQFNTSGGARSDPTFRNSVRAAALANLLIAAPVLYASCGIALVDHDPKALRMGLWCVAIATPVVWGSAALLYLLEVAPRWRGALGRWLAARFRSPQSAKSGVWDDWLDSPEPHGRWPRDVGSGTDP